MKASDAKKFIGKFVSYKKGAWPLPRHGTVESVSGRNIFMDDDVLWAPDISEMQLVELPVSGPESVGSQK